MRTTEQWWQDISNNEDELIDWLKDQYHGEVTAESRIRNMIQTYNLQGKQKKLITKIADDEKTHAEWVKELLVSRGIPAEVLNKEERYWNKVLPKEETTFSYMCAVGHLAETMRLDRISLLAKDSRFIDIYNVFNKILPDETFHVEAFKSMTTDEDIQKAKLKHQDGMNAIGLVV